MVTLSRFVEIEKIMARCKGAYADHTLRGYAADLRSFEAWCTAHDAAWLPAEPDLVAGFIDAAVETLSSSSLRRRLAAISFAHRMSDLSNPTAASAVRLAMRRVMRRKDRRPNQAKGLSSEILTRILAGLPDTPAGLRDGALISVGYDTLCRSIELSAMTVERLRCSADGNWSVLISRSKSDQAGDGRVAWLSPDTGDRLQRWLETAGITEGPLFRALHLGRVSPEPLRTCSIRRLIKRAARRAGLEAGKATELSGHSMRVGAAQDMMVAGFDALAIMQAGGWKSPTVMLRYVENASTRSLYEKRWRTQPIAPAKV